MGLISQQAMLWIVDRWAACLGIAYNLNGRIAGGGNGQASHQQRAGVTRIRTAFACSAAGRWDAVVLKLVVVRGCRHGEVLALEYAFCARLYLTERRTRLTYRYEVDRYEVDEVR